MLDAVDLEISGMDFDQGLLWIAVPNEGSVSTYDPATGKIERRLGYPREIWDVAADRDGLWLVRAGGKLGREIVFWSLPEQRETAQFDCPDGAASGLTCFQGKLWLSHRHNRKLFCLDRASGRVNWVIRTDRECFSPSAFNNELWLIESDPGPLGHWSRVQEHRCFFSRFDPVRECVVERLALSFVPSCMARDGERFWYAELGKKGLASTKQDLRQL